MLKKIIATMIILALTGLLPVLAGCDQPEVTSHQHKESTEKETHPVVE